MKLYQLVKMKLVKKPEYTFLSSLQCKEIADIINKQKIGFLSTGICGDACENKICIYYKPGYSNSFIPVFYGKISRDVNSSLIKGDFKMFGFVKFFLWVWRIFTMLMLIIVLSASLGSDFKTENLFVGISVPSVMFILSIVLERAGYYIGRSGITEVLCFMEKQLLAYPTTLNDNKIK